MTAPCDQWDTDDAASDDGILADRAYERDLDWELGVGP